jgi:hypothetical protein
MANNNARRHKMPSEPELPIPLTLNTLSLTRYQKSAQDFFPKIRVKSDNLWLIAFNRLGYLPFNLHQLTSGPLAYRQITHLFGRYRFGDVHIRDPCNEAAIMAKDQVADRRVETCVRSAYQTVGPHA